MNIHKTVLPKHSKNKVLIILCTIVIQRHVSQCQTKEQIMKVKENLTSTELVFPKLISCTKLIKF